MRFRNLDLLVNHHKRTGSALAVVFALLIVLVLAVPGGNAENPVVGGSHSSDAFGLQAGMSTPGTPLAPSRTDPFNTYLSMNGPRPSDNDFDADTVVASVSTDSSPLGATISLTSAQGYEGETLKFVLQVDGSLPDEITGLILAAGSGEDLGLDATATSVIDYAVYRKTVGFAAPTVIDIYVPTYHDDLTEPTEWFYVIFLCDNCVPYTRLTVKGTILDDSAVASSLSLGDATVTEGNAGATTANFSVNLTPASASTVTVDYSTCGVGCDPSATATGGDDYELSVDSLTFSPWQTSKIIPVTINGDTMVESDEIFFIYLYDATNASIADNQGRGTIVNDDSPPPPSPPPNTFVDDDGSVFEQDIEWMAAAGITKGCNPPTNNKFCPDASVTRGQMAAFLVRALGLAEQLDDPFVDDDDSIFEADIERLAAGGITKGCNPPTNNRFCPDAKVSREQMAAFLVRALGYSDNGGGDLFVDDDDSIFEADIDRLATAGVTKGCNPPTNNQFCPTNDVTRAQMAAFLHRALG